MKGHVLKGSHLLTFRNLAKSIRQTSAVGFAEALTTRTATPSLDETASPPCQDVSEGAASGRGASRVPSMSPFCVRVF
jgi:hypothetical protein